MSLIWVGIAFCITRSAIFSGLNLAVFSISKLRLEVEAAGGNHNALGLLALRKDSNLTLATVALGQCDDQRAAHPALGLRPSRRGSVCFFDNCHHTVRRNISASLFFAARAAHGRAARACAEGLPGAAVSGREANRDCSQLVAWTGRDPHFYASGTFGRLSPSTWEPSSNQSVGQLEAIGALNFLDLDDILVEG